MFQYWDFPKDSISGLVWGDQSFRYKKQFLFGAGIVGVLKVVLVAIFMR